MSEYIKKEDALDACYEETSSKWSTKEEAEEGQIIASAIRSIPSADVVEVVRCKDCKFWDSDCIWCELWGNTQEYGNGFCSYGERKDNE